MWVAGSATHGPIACTTAAYIIDANITRSQMRRCRL